MKVCYVSLFNSNLIQTIFKENKVWRTYVQTSTYIVQPFKSQGFGIGFDVTFKINIMAGSYIVGI